MVEHKESLQLELEDFHTSPCLAPARKASVVSSAWQRWHVSIGANSPANCEFIHWMQTHLTQNLFVLIRGNWNMKLMSKDFLAFYIFFIFLYPCRFLIFICVASSIFPVISHSFKNPYILEILFHNVLQKRIPQDILFSIRI